MHRGTQMFDPQWGCLEGGDHIRGLDLLRVVTFQVPIGSAIQYRRGERHPKITGLDEVVHRIETFHMARVSENRAVAEGARSPFAATCKSGDDLPVC